MAEILGTNALDNGQSSKVMSSRSPSRHSFLFKPFVEGLITPLFHRSVDMVLANAA